MTDKPTLDDDKVRCPPPKDGHDLDVGYLADLPKNGDDLEGCGSFNVTGPDNRGMYNCDDCDLWFDEETARAATKVRPQVEVEDIEPALEEANRIIAEGRDA